MDKLFRGIAVGAGITQGSIHNEGGRQTAPDVVHQVQRSVGRVDCLQMRRDPREPCRLEEGIGGHGFGRMGGEIVAHELQKCVISHPLPKRIQKEHAPGLLAPILVERGDRVGLKAAPGRALGIHCRAHVFGLKHLVIFS